MSKTTLSLFVLLTLTVLTQSVTLENNQLRISNDQPNLTDKEIIQQALNGAFEQNKLPDPTTIVACFDDDTAHKVVLFAGEVLGKAASGSVKDTIALVKLVQDFGNQIPEPVKNCLNNNAQLKVLGLKYGIDDSTSSSQIEKKVILYLTLHYSTVHGWAGKLNDQWKGGKYYQVGFDGAGYAHNVLGINEEVPNPTDKQILQQALNGIFEPNGLPDPVTIVPCFDDASAHLTVIFIGKVLHDAAKLTPTSPSEIQKIKDEAQQFSKNLPQPVKDCLDGNQQFAALGLKYGIDDKTDTDALEKRIIKNLALHPIDTHKALQDIDNQWQSGGYKNTGNQLASLAHKLVK